MSQENVILTPEQLKLAIALAFNNLNADNFMVRPS